MPTVTISSIDYDVYADTDTADEFLLADFGATAWRAETIADQKARALVTATRLFDRLQWTGEKDDPDQLHAFPRSGTGLADVVDDEVPLDIINGSIVLAKLIHAGSKVDSSQSTASNIRRQRAGSVEIEYFFPQDDQLRLPVEVMELVGRYLGGTDLAGMLASGTDCRSIICNPFTVGFPG